MLNRICDQLRIDLAYYDIWGHQHHASDAAKRAILESLGVAASDDSGLKESWLELERARAAEILDPVTVLAAEGPSEVLVRCLPEERGGSLQAALYTETGGALKLERRLSELPATDDSGLSLRLILPWTLELGYHDLEVEIRAPGRPARRAAQRLIVAPNRAYLPERLQRDGRLAGVAVSLYGLRTARDWGVGDFTDLDRFVQWAARSLRVSVVALNPLHAIHNREPYNTSPYLPLSAYYRNFLYLDIERIPVFSRCPAAQALLRRPKIQAAIERLRASDLVDYEGVARLKRAFLRLLFREFLRAEWTPRTAEAREFQRFLAQEGDLLRNFAIYCALDEVLHARDRNRWTWRDWPAEYQDPDSAAVRAFAELHWRRVLYHQWVQWQIDRQLEAVQSSAREAGMEIGLYHDLALATDSCGSDLWAYRRFFAQGCRVGSPPDGFAPEGQDWAFPPPQPEQHRRDGYRLFTETIRKNSRHAGALRIDHFMRFHRLFWIPDGMPAREGTYVRERFEDLMRILALESVRGQFMVIGEDLGTCPPEVRDGMARFGVLSYRLFYFEKGSDGLQRRPEHFPHLALVSSTTHDLPTLAGFWGGRDIEARKSAGLLSDPAWYDRLWAERHTEKAQMIETLIRDGCLPADFPREAAGWPELTGELHNAIIGWLCSTPSALMLLNQEDLTKETEQQNLPGTTTEYPNWKRKMKLTLEQLEGAEAAGFVAMFRSWLEKSGRAIGGAAKP